MSLTIRMNMQLRKDYRVIKSIKEQPGFQWNGELCMLVASDEAWDNYIKVLSYKCFLDDRR